VPGDVNVRAAEILCSAVVDDGPKSSHAPPTLVIKLPALCAIALPHITPGMSARHAIRFICPSYFISYPNLLADKIVSPITEILSGTIDSERCEK
jgi:hypothetical protein